ncbi:FKBP-type peptidyl-prolyl cis-trans isomerase [Pedobacter panaciterrae]|jgi:FKBP-type peptidyl-prolyl cis-trans isomerases 1|uniref:Peptidyl-prolyl cis-trans isomerase n=1 Tax=Pedobacter panaciterrae TaxID=363849 RepID=A0ABU8NQE4_9SPHI|nr:FKBP-type peptidyl-prolyl cis-trans isomerase [uncultured Pedobacter sp.]
MKKIAIALLLPLCSVAALAQTSKKPTTTTKKATATKSVQKPIAKPAFKTTLDSASYSFGITMASSMKKDGLNALNYDLLVQGLKDAFNDKPFALTTQGSQSAINNLFATLSKKKFGPAIAEGTAFLENNKKQPGVQVTATGLQYQVITKGTGIMPKATDSVLVHYKGTLLNGKQFDSSYDRGEPISFPLNNVIAGWTEGVQLMPAGSKYKFFIPYNLAYGERGAGQDIPPYSTLVFEIELLKVNGK